MTVNTTSELSDDVCQVKPVWPLATCGRGTCMNTSCICNPSWIRSKVAAQNYDDVCILNTKIIETLATLIFVLAAIQNILMILKLTVFRKKKRRALKYVPIFLSIGTTYAYSCFYILFGVEEQQFLYSGGVTFFCFFLGKIEQLAALTYLRKVVKSVQSSELLFKKDRSVRILNMKLVIFFCVVADLMKIGVVVAASYRNIFLLRLSMTFCGIAYGCVAIYVYVTFYKFINNLKDSISVTQEFSGVGGETEGRMQKLINYAKINQIFAGQGFAVVASVLILMTAFRFILYSSDFIGLIAHFSVNLAFTVTLMTSLKGEFEKKQQRERRRSSVRRRSSFFSKNSRVHSHSSSSAIIGWS